MIAIAPTDLNWFKFLKNRLNFQIINFWTDNPWNPRRLKKDNKFYFLLKTPIRKIGGYANFSYSQNLSITQAWQKFGQGNGVSSLYELGVKATGATNPDYDTEIGCIVLENPVFLEPEEYFHPDDYNLSFSAEISKHKYYPNLEEINIAGEYKQAEISFSSISCETDYKFDQSSALKGQSKFRQNLFKYYKGKGVITKENCAAILDAVHIHPYLKKNKDHLKNGLLLRSDLHQLFDDGLITITPDYKVLVSKKLDSNHYHKYQNQDIYLPQDNKFYPEQQVLKFHNHYIFRDQI
ncbi:MAG: HNH endonuclease [Bacillota bacterium]